MALVFQMWIESKDNGEEIRNYFSSIKQIIANGKQYEIRVFETGNTGSMITVDGVSQTGIHSISDAEEMTEIGFQFYEYLKNAPDFRYALVGIEVDEWREIEELFDAPNDIKGMKRFVISEEIYSQMECMVNMVKFVRDYLWLPYEGEKYIEMKNK